MNALLLAAGLGTRLRPYTNKTPKCLMPVKGSPILKTWIDSMMKLKPYAIYINTHYLSKQVDNFINIEYSSLPIITCYEKELLGTGRTLVNLLPQLLGSSCLLAHADNIIDFDLGELIYAHENRPQNTLLTAITFITEAPKNFGIFEVDEHGVAFGFHEKIDSPPGNIANGAIYLLSKEAIALIDSIENKNTLIDFSLNILPLFIDKIFCHQIDGEVIDIGTIDNYLKVNKMKKYD